MIELLIRYQFHEHIVLACLGFVGFVVALCVIIAVWGSMWNRLWCKDRIIFNFCIAIIFSFLLYPGFLICLSSESLRRVVAEMRENPEKIHAVADKMPSKPGDDANSYHGELTVFDKKKAEQVRDKTEEAHEQRMLILAKNLDHDKLFIPVRRYFTYDTPIAINWNELPYVIKMYIKGMIRDNYVSFYALTNYNRNKPHIQKRNLEEWGAKAMRYLLIRQNIELIVMEEKDVFQQYSRDSKLYITIILFLYLIIIPWKACSDIKSHP